MSDETPERPVKKRKKRPAGSAASAPVRAEVVTVRAGASEGAKQWTSGAVAGALVVGLAVGGAGGWYYRGTRSATATRDQAAASGDSSAAKRPQRPPAPNAYVPLASYSPREGPEHAKVTIVEFSDFQ